VPPFLKVDFGRKNVVFEQKKGYFDHKMVNRDLKNGLARPKKWSTETKKRSTFTIAMVNGDQKKVN